MISGSSQILQTRGTSLPVQEFGLHTGDPVPTVYSPIQHLWMLCQGPTITGVWSLSVLHSLSVKAVDVLKQEFQNSVEEWYRESPSPPWAWSEVQAQREHEITGNDLMAPGWRAGSVESAPCFRGKWNWVLSSRVVAAGGCNGPGCLWLLSSLSVDLPWQTLT